MEVIIQNKVAHFYGSHCMPSNKLTAETDLEWIYAELILTSHANDKLNLHGSANNIAERDQAPTVERCRSSPASIDLHHFVKVSFSQCTGTQTITVCLLWKEVEQSQQSRIFHLIEVVSLLHGTAEWTRLVQAKYDVQVIVHLTFHNTIQYSTTRTLVSRSGRLLSQI